MNKSPAYSFIKERIELEFERLKREKITPWYFFCTDKGVRLTDFFGKQVSYTGGVREFEGPPREYFWNGFIQPFLNNIASNNFSATEDFCRKKKLDWKLPLEETASLLKIEIKKIYAKMADIDRRLRGKGYPNSVPPYNPEREVASSLAFVDQRLIAEVALQPSKKRWKWAIVVWGIIGGITIITGLLVDVTGLYDRFIQKADPKITNPVLVVKEYIFGNQYFYLQVLTDSSDRVLAYGVTTRKADFNPSFKILEHGRVLPDNVEKANPFAHKITLGKTHFSDFPYSPENIFAYLGARRLYYHEEYYFGNPGDYQSYFIGVNDSGYVDINYDNFDFSLKDEINPDDKNVANFRKRSTINTILVTFPKGFGEPALRKYLIGPDLDQVRVISDAAMITSESRYSLLNKLKSLSTEVNIQLYINRFGHPLIINDHPFLEIRNDQILFEQPRFKKKEADFIKMLKSMKSVNGKQ